MLADQFQHFRTAMSTQSYSNSGLEKLRPEVKQEMLSKDEGDLFNIANNFTIRHLNPKQQGNYDSAIWHQWTFYVNLSTIHVITRLINRKNRRAVGKG
jgi:hypothetical protein